MFIIVILAVSSLIMIKTAYAQTIPKPSAPTFTVQLVGPSFTRNTTYSLDSNTGQVIANVGYTNQYSYLVLTIKNQLFEPSYGSLYYNIRIKNQNTPYENWTVVTYANSPNPKQTTGFDFTNLSLTIDGQWGLNSLAGTQTDIQVQAMLGDFYYGHSTPPITSGFMFTGVTSDWSNTQNVIIPANTPLSSTNSPSPSSPTLAPTSSPIASQNPAATPDQPDTQWGVLFGLDWEQIAILLLGVVVVLLVVVVVLQRKSRGVVH